MKFSLVAALVVILALAHGCESVSLVKRDAHMEVDTLIKYVQDLSSLVTKTTQGLVERAKTHELTGKANAYIEDGRTQLQPLVQQIQKELKPLAASIKEQLKPLTEPLQAQLKPFSDSIQPELERIWKTLLDATKAFTN
ncbi:type-4 ice-structuring protein LS-12-like isoform X2 [Anguilla rostrata]|uniref:type-4 ice-structuring protein LS-12-like isoform X2 n=1 Tax=Anguilla rostrata TaxID=7938 RepID=UPI0030D13053